MEYGYCRISTQKQKLERQIENITKAYPTAIIIEEIYTGTKETRPEWQKLLKNIKPNDTIIFDSVSRMSRNGEEGFKTYMDLYNKGVNLIFLKESTINTESFKSVLGNEKLSFEINTNDEDTDNLVNGIMIHVKTYITKLAEKQIKLAFEQSQKEVDDLQKRTSEGLRVAKAMGKRIGLAKGSTLTTKKSIKAKELIMKYNQDFNGNKNNEDTISFINRNSDIKISRNSFYKYKKELQEESTY